MANNERYISTNADISVKRSRNFLTRKTKHSYFHGYLQPLGSPIEVLPGDTIKAKISAFTRMSSPIVPFLDDIREEVDAFFVPKRIIWDHTKQFYGESPSFGIAAKINEPRSPTLPVANSSLTTNLLKSETIGAAFGCINNAVSGSVYLNLNPVRAFFSVYNEYFRDENYQDQYKWNKTESGDNVFNVATRSGNSVLGLSYLPQVNKDRDVISSILPYQVKGNPITLQVSGTLPLKASATDNFALGNVMKLGHTNLNGSGKLQAYLGSIGLDSTTTSSVANTIDHTNLYIDASSGLSIGVSEMLYALAYQDFLARAAHFGTRMKEYIYSMFGCRIPDLSDDVPEYLGRMRFGINVQQVVQTTGFQPDDSSELGSLGAYSNSGKYDELFTKSFTEPGYIILVFYTKHQRTYSSGVDSVFTKHELLDYYQPPFANIPDVPISSSIVWLEANTSFTSLGFQEPWWDYRYLLDRTYGLMNPMLDTLGELWTLGEKWTAKPSITANFMVEDRNAIARTLVTGVDGPDYICDFLLELDATRVMPLYSDGRLGRF